MIGILDLGVCNLKSIYNAVYSLGFDVEIIDKKNLNKLDKNSHIPCDVKIHQMQIACDAKVTDAIRNFKVDIDSLRREMSSKIESISRISPVLPTHVRGPEQTASQRPRADSYKRKDRDDDESTDPML